MSPVDRAAQMKAALANRVQESHKHRDDSGQFKSIFIESADLKFWKCGTGEHLIDIIPYIAGKHDPDPKIKEGDITYVLIIWVHYAVGTNQNAYVCPARNYNLPCPICEYREELRKQDDYDEDLVKSLNPKRRSIYNVIVYDNEKETAKGIQIFDVAHWFMERHLSGLAKIPSVGPSSITPYVPFADLQDGKIVAFERVGTKQNSDFISHRFIDRNYQLPMEYLDQAYKLDEFVTLSSYDEIKSAFYGGEETEQAEEVASAPAPTPPPIAPPSPSLKPRMPLPTPPATAPGAAPIPTPAPTPTPKKPAPVASNECPAGGEFGMCEQYEQCTGCPSWDPCSAEADRRAVAASKESAPPPNPAPTPVTRPAPAATPRPTPAPAARPAPATPAPATGPRRGLPTRR